MYFRYNLTEKVSDERGCLYYLPNEHSLCYVPWRKNSYTLLIGKSYCGLDLDADTGEIMQISGCNPMRLWIECNLEIPVAVMGRVFFQSDIPLIPGTGSDYDRSWNTFYDRKQQYICLGPQPIISDCIHIQFAPYLIASIRNDQIVSIWAKIKIKD
jgi:hypothetical protein